MLIYVWSIFCLKYVLINAWINALIYVFILLGTCHGVSCLFVSFVDLSEVTSQKEQQMTRISRIPRGMYLVNNAIINALCNALINALMYVSMCDLIYALINALTNALLRSCFN